MKQHDTCTKQCSLSTFLKRDEEACEDGHCEKQELANYANDPADTETESKVDMKAARDNFA